MTDKTVKSENSQVSLKEKAEKLELNYLNKKKDFDQLLGNDSKAYMDAFITKAIFDNETRDEFIKLADDDIAAAISKGKAIAEKYGIEKEDASIYDTLIKSKQKISDLQHKNEELKKAQLTEKNFSTEKLPDLKTSAPQIILEHNQYNNLFNGR